MHSLRPSLPAHGSELRAVALLDARYLRWLAQLEAEGSAEALALSRNAINELVEQVFARADLRCRLLRTYWYAEADDQAVCDDHALRLLAPDPDGAVLVRQMAGDLQALAASGRVDAVLLGSDDDRLATCIEAAQLAGLKVCLLADERALAMPRLMQQDPNWARLLRQADRRLVVRSAELARVLLQGDEDGAQRPFAARDDELQAVVRTWWEQVPLAEQQALRDELPSIRGLPPEADRDLLLRCKNALKRGLLFPEKRMLREYARRTMQGQAGQESPPAATLPDSDAP